MMELTVQNVLKETRLRSISTDITSIVAVTVSSIKTGFKNFKFCAV